jgi:peptidyl-prolyl cis-trans isomerase B (cyclophilin B)
MRPKGDSRRQAIAAIRLPVVLVALAIGAVGCGGSGDGSTGAATASGCRDAQRARTRSASYRAPPQTVRRGEELTAVVSTNCGSFSVALDAKRSPTVVNSFVFLARKGFYDGVPFDRAGGGKYLHGGNPPGPADGPGYSVTGKVPPLYVYRHGIVAMSQAAEAKPGHSGSQFFIVLAKPWLDFSSIYAPFGSVKSGFDVLDRISNLGPSSKEPGNLGTVGTIGKLRRPVVIEKISIEKG